MLEIEAERRLETVAVIGLTLPIRSLLRCAGGIGRMLNRLPKLSAHSRSFEFPFDVTA